MVSTASFFPNPVTTLPKDSIKVDFPTPGTPVIPTRKLSPVCGRINSKTCSANSTSEGNLLSINVIARESMILSPANIASAYSAGANLFLGVYVTAIFDELI